MRLGIPILCVTAFLGAFVSAMPAQPKPAGKITEVEIKQAINHRSGVYECASLDQIHIDHLEYFDFLGDPNQQAIVVASTCMTGTAGPDVAIQPGAQGFHRFFSRGTHTGR